MKFWPWSHRKKPPMELDPEEVRKDQIRRHDLKNRQEELNLRLRFLEMEAEADVGFQRNSGQASPCDRD
jgi:hypothetical protein